MGMILWRSELLPGEERVVGRVANAVVGLKEYGLDRLQMEQFMGLVGMQGQEAIGGAL